jgi:RNA-directed DNA polymerase
MLQGWSNYFCYGTRGQAYQATDLYVASRLRAFLARQHRMQGRGSRRFSSDVIYRDYGALCLQRLPRRAPSCASR